jgi:hypothetical protein
MRDLYKSIDYIERGMLRGLDLARPTYFRNLRLWIERQLARPKISEILGEVCAPRIVEFAASAARWPSFT